MVLNSRIAHFRFLNCTAMLLQSGKTADSFAFEFNGLL